MLEAHSKYLLQVAAVHMYPVLTDTADLSTARGTSAAFLDTIALIERKLGELGESTNTANGLTPNFVSVSTGASRGTWLVDYQTDDATRSDLSKIVNKVRDWLAQGDKDVPCQHLSFVVNASPVLDTNDSLSSVLRPVDAANAWMAMRTPSVFVSSDPETATGDSTRGLKQICDLTMTRRADRTARVKGADIVLSRSVFERRRYGREARRLTQDNNYVERLFARHPQLPSIPDGVDFPLHFESIAAGPGESLEDKIAVIYMDGNGFGKKRTSALDVAVKAKGGDYITEIAALREFDERIQTVRLDMLAQVLDRLAEPKTGALRPPAQDESDERAAIGLSVDAILPLDMLLWGGDELVWLVPAAYALEVVRWAFAESDAPQRPDGKWPHAAGIVFCDYRAPIQASIELAEGLAQQCKVHFPEQSAVCFENVTSADHAVFSTENFLSGRCPPALGPRFLCLPFELESRDPDPDKVDERYLESVVHLVTKLKEPGLTPPFPRRQLRRFVAGLMIGPKPRIALSQFLSSLPFDANRSWGDVAQSIEDFRRHFGSRHSIALWVHIERLWTYVQGPNQDSSDSEEKVIEE